MPRRYNTRDAKDAVTGDIFWLSPRPTVGGGSQINKGIRDIFDHPVLVLSIHTAEHIACVLIVRSSFSILCVLHLLMSIALVIERQKYQ